MIDISNDVQHIIYTFNAKGKREKYQAFHIYFRKK